MNKNRRFYALRYDYSDPLEQHMAAILVKASLFLAILTGAALLDRVVLWTAIVPLEILVFLLLLAPVPVIIPILVNNGRATAASYLLLGYMLIAALTVMLVYGLGTGATLALAFPVVLSGWLLDRRGMSATVGLALAAVGGVGILEAYVLDRAPSFVAVVWPPALLIGAYGVGLWVFVGQLRDVFARLQRVENIVHTTIRLSEDVTHQAALDPILSEFSRQMYNAYDLQQTLIYLQAADNPGILQLRSGTGLAAQRALAAGQQISTNESYSITRAFRERQPLAVRITDNVLAHESVLPEARSQLCLPLQYGDQVFGVADLQSADPDLFDADTITLLAALARQLSTNIYTRELNNRLDWHAQEHELLYARIQQSAEEIRELRQRAAGIVWSRFFQDRGANVLGFDLDPETREPIPGETMPPTLQRTVNDGEIAVQPTDQGYRLSLPIAARGQMLGAMEFNIDRDGDLPQHLIDLASTIADRLSLALENVRLVEETQALASREQQVGTIVSRLQGASNLEELLAMAAEEFNVALDGSRTQIRLQSYGWPPAPSAPETPTKGGGAL